MAKVLLVTGYKAHEIGIFNDDHPGLHIIKTALRTRISQLIEDMQFEWILISGQTGIELWAGEVALDLREEFPELKLAVLTPFLDQEKKWKESSQEYYHMILSEADFVETITNRPYENPGQLKAKNEFLVKKSDAMLILYDEDTPGSPDYYLKEADNRNKHQSGYEVYTITPIDLDLLQQDMQESDPDFYSQ
ncbi:SLOG family protein [Alkalihalobacillus sp. R86527]|uniref:SLOG family protein n=1 Tax=Alkalihalobacillus sp. R86527 TaxID=3093863 RepID=UPI003670EF25